MQTDVIQLFCDVAAYRSISKAAGLHGVTQSAASQRIQALERELGVVLMDRSKRPLELTAAGELYLRGCRKIVASYEKLTERVAGEGQAALMRGEVTIAAIYSAGIDLLNQVQAGFEALHPHAAVTIHYQQPEGVYDSVRRGGCDVGILSYPQQWRGLVVAPMREEVMALAVRRAHPWAAREVVHPEELAGQPMVGFEETLPIARHIRGYLREHGVAPHFISEFDNIDTIKSFIAQTDAAGILPGRTVQREAAAGVLATVALDPAPLRPLGVVRLRQRPLTVLAKAFVEYLLSHQPPRWEARSAALTG